MFNEDPLSFLIESRALKGERRSTYWCMPVILYSLFSILPSFSFLSLKENEMRGREVPPGVPEFVSD